MKKLQLKFKLPFKIKLTQIKLPKLGKINWKQFKDFPLKKKIKYSLITLGVLVLLMILVSGVCFLRKSGQKMEEQTGEAATETEEALELEQELKSEDYDYTGWQTYEIEGYSIQCPASWYCDQVISPTQPQGPMMEDLTIFIYQDHQPSWDYFELQMQNEENRKAKVKIGEQEWEKVEFTVTDKNHQDYRFEQDGRKFTLNVVTPKDKDQSEYLDLVPQILASFKVL